MSSAHLLRSWYDSIHFMSLSRNISVSEDTITIAGELSLTSSSSLSSMRVTSWYAVNALDMLTLERMSLLSRRMRLQRALRAYGSTVFPPSIQTTSSSSSETALTHS